MSLGELILKHELQLSQADDQLYDLYARIESNQITLPTEQFEDSEERGLHSLSLPDLDAKYNELRNVMNELNTLKVVSKDVEELHHLIAKENPNTLDFHRTFQLFATLEVSCTSHTDLIIYQQILKDVAELRLQFSTQLNNYLKSLIPSPTKVRPLVIGEFNQLLERHLIKLEWYTYLKEEWDVMVETLPTLGWKLHQRELEDGDEELELSKAPESSFLQLTLTFIEYINAVDLEAIRRYLNSKLGRVVVETVLKNINRIINDQSEVNAILELTKFDGWQLFPQFDSELSIQDNLKVIYDYHKVDEDIDKIRNIFAEEISLKDWELPLSGEEFSTTEHAENPQPHTGQSGQSATEAPGDVNDDDDGWGDQWDDDAWSGDEAKATKSVPADDESEDNWDDWGDDTQTSAPTSPAKKRKVGQVKKPNCSSHIQVHCTDYPRQLLPLIKDHESSTDLISAINALAIQTYPPTTELLLLYNDMFQLSDATGNDKFRNFGIQQWRQTQTAWYQFLGNTLAALDLSDENDNVDSLLDDFELDGANLDKVLQIHHWIEGRLLLDLGLTNAHEFKRLMLQLIDYINNRFILEVLNLGLITEFQLAKISAVINHLKNLTVPTIIALDIPTDKVPSVHRLDNLKLLVNRLLNEIMDHFYNGDFYDYTTDELIRMIEQVFINLELRTQSIQEIIEVRTAS